MPLWNFGQPLDGIIQVAFIVEDIRKAMPVYAERFNIGPWFLIEHFEFEWVKYRGKPTDIDISLCLGNSGSMMFELIQQHDDSPSVYQETRDKRGWGFHHLATATTPERYDAVQTEHLSRGASLALDACVKVGGRASYMDYGDLLPGMIELIEVTPAVEGLFTMIRTANLGWDGTDPLRVL